MGAAVDSYRSRCDRREEAIRTRYQTILTDPLWTRVRLPPPPPLDLLKTKGEILDAGTVPGVSTRKCVGLVPGHGADARGAPDSGLLHPRLSPHKAGRRFLRRLPLHGPHPGRDRARPVTGAPPARGRRDAMRLTVPGRWAYFADSTLIARRVRHADERRRGRVEEARVPPTGDPDRRPGLPGLGRDRRAETRRAGAPAARLRGSRGP